MLGSSTARNKSRLNTAAVMQLIQQMPEMADHQSIALDIKGALADAMSNLKEVLGGS